MSLIFKSWKFLSTPSARRATFWRLPPWCSQADFYPRPPRGGRPRHPRRSKDTLLFLSTPSARRATQGGCAMSKSHLPISIHALREEGDFLPIVAAVFSRISIHALREEGDSTCIP